MWLVTTIVVVVIAVAIIGAFLGLMVWLGVGDPPSGDEWR